MQNERGPRPWGGRHAAYLAVLCLLVAFLPQARHAVLPSPVEAQPQGAPPLTDLPLGFVPNRGQWNARILFAAQGPGYVLSLTADGFLLRVPQPRERAASLPRASLPASTTLRFAMTGGGLRHPSVEGLHRLPGRVNYFLGNDRRHWRRNLPSYAGIRYGNVYPGVDLTFNGRGGTLEYAWTVHPGAALPAIPWRVYGAAGLHLDGAGNLHIQVRGGEILGGKPSLYQPGGQARRRVAGGYTLPGGNGLGLKTDGSYNHAAPLVVDPTLIYGTSFGGNKSDVSLGIGVDKGGNTYITGSTQSDNFPSVHPVQLGTGHDLNLFVAKLDPAGTALEYSTFISGTHTITGTPGVDEGLAIAVDGAGDAYVTGDTDTVNYPTVHAAQRANRSHCTLNGLPIPCEDAVVTKLSPDGATLLYSTYIGGDSSDIGQGIAIDKAGSAYVTGKTDSTNFPAVHAFQSRQKGDFCLDDGGDQTPCTSAFVTRLSPSGTAFEYSTYLGGTGNSAGNGIDIDSHGRAMIAGDTMAKDFPLVHPIQKSIPGPHVGFVSLLSAAGDHLAFSTFLGGSSQDQALNIAASPDGSMNVTGLTQSTNFPLKDAFQSTSQTGSAFVTRISPAGKLIFSTYLGGTEGQDGFGIAVDRSGNAWVTGDTGSSDFPLLHPLQAKLRGETNAFISEFSPVGRLLYSTYLGGTGMDAGLAITLGRCGAPYVTGGTSSPDFPGTHLRGTGGGDQDIFVTRLSPSGSCATSGRAAPIPKSSPTAAPAAARTGTKGCKKGYALTKGTCTKVKQQP